MKFIINEIRLWFNKPVEPKSIILHDNKVNIITGDSSTGKSSIMRVINYCLLSDKSKIVQDIINENVDWYSLSLNLNDKNYIIARKSPTIETVSSEVYFEERDSFPQKIYSNIEINELKSFLDLQFGITDKVRFPLGEDFGPSQFILSFRYFLLFNCLTEDIIGTSDTYFDTNFFGKKEYEEALLHIFNMVIGIDDMRDIKAQEMIKIINEEIDKIQKDYSSNINAEKRFERAILQLIDKCKINNLIEFNKTFESIEDAVSELQEIVSQYRKQANNELLFKELEELTKRKNSLKYQIRNIENFKKEYTTYRKNLNNYKDSLLPIEYIKENFTEVFQSYETKVLLDSLAESLINIKNSYSPNKLEPFEFSDRLSNLNKEMQEVSNRIEQLSEIKKPFETEASKYIAVGEVRSELKSLVDRRKPQLKLDSKRINELTEERQRLIQITNDTSDEEMKMRQRLNDSIQRNYNQVNSMPTYKNCRTEFFTDDMVLKLWRPLDFFPIDNVGSKSNYMFMHLCFFLGLHEHMIKVGQVHVPQFLFIDQPSIPYYSDKDKVSSDDRKKLLDAFSLINSFMEYIVRELKANFQILMVEHAPKDYWESNNNFGYFKTVDEFEVGDGLIPKYVLEYKEDEN